MQKRLMQRYDSVFDVILYHQETSFFTGEAENVSSDGIFIKTDATELPEGDHLKIGFNYSANGRTKNYRLPVSIVHRGNDGLGLKFIRIADDQNIFPHAILGYLSRENRQPGYQSTHNLLKFSPIDKPDPVDTSKHITNLERQHASGSSR